MYVNSLPGNNYFPVNKSNIAEDLGDLDFWSALVGGATAVVSSIYGGKEKKRQAKEAEKERDRARKHEIKLEKERTRAIELRQMEALRAKSGLMTYVGIGGALLGVGVVAYFLLR